MRTQFRITIFEESLDKYKIDLEIRYAGFIKRLTLALAVLFNRKICFTNSVIDKSLLEKDGN